MAKNHKALCGSKLVLVDSFDFVLDKRHLKNTTSVEIYVCDNPHSIKRYCKDTGLEFKEAFTNVWEYKMVG